MKAIQEIRGFWFHVRVADGDTPEGFTVSKRKRLPPGDFRITEYLWGEFALWFVDADNFTEDERKPERFGELAGFAARGFSGHGSLFRMRE